MAVDDPSANGHEENRDEQATREEAYQAQSDAAQDGGSRKGGGEGEERRAPDAEEPEAPEGDASGPEDEDLTEEEQLRRELEEVRDKLLRKTADFENFRKRMKTVRREARAKGRAEVAEKMLAVLDDLERSVEAARQTEEEGEVGPEFRTLEEGVEMVYGKLQDELERLGIEPIEAEGRPFDESVHDALMQKEAPEGVEPGTVIQVLEKGYRMEDRVLRHARVVVAQ